MKFTRREFFYVPWQGRVCSPVLKHKGLIGFFIIFFISFNSGLGWAQTQQENSCITCHSDTAEETRGSVHSQHGISCYHCHGGDPTKEDQESAKAPSTGFIGIPNKRQLVEKCGGCHADVEVMNFYGIFSVLMVNGEQFLHIFATCNIHSAEHLYGDSPFHNLLKSFENIHFFILEINEGKIAGKEKNLLFCLQKDLFELT